MGLDPGTHPDSLRRLAHVSPLLSSEAWGAMVMGLMAALQSANSPKLR
jgi:hypothetical protein